MLAPVVNVRRRTAHRIIQKAGLAGWSHYDKLRNVAYVHSEHPSECCHSQLSYTHALPKGDSCLIIVQAVRCSHGAHNLDQVPGWQTREGHCGQV